MKEDTTPETTVDEAAENVDQEETVPVVEEVASPSADRSAFNCVSCGGEGLVNGQICSNCGGTGKV